MDKAKATEQLDLSGVFFQDYCAALIKSLTGFNTRTEEPFTYPPSNGPLTGLSASIDVLAVYSDSRKSLCFAVECKRALPQTKHWLFFRTGDDVRKVCFLYRPWGPPDPHLKMRSLTYEQMGYWKASAYESCDRALEVDEQFRALNKTKDEKTYRALLQANHGLVACLFSKQQQLSRMCRASPRPMYFAPVVVTTANLFLADYNPSKVDPATGQLSPTDINYQSKQWVEFEFGLPDYLATEREGELFGRASTFVVNAKSISDFFEKIARPDGF